MWVAITLASLSVIVLGGWLFAKWRLKKKGWKAGGGFWLVVLLLYIGIWAYIKYPFNSEQPKKIEKVELKKDTLNIQKA